MSEIYDELGGPDGVRTAVTVFYNRVLADEELGGYFDGVDLDRLKAHQRAFLAAAFGGPQVFSGRGMREAHADLAITDLVFDAMVSTLLTSLADIGVAKHAVGAVAERLEGVRGEIVSA